MRKIKMYKIKMRRNKNYKSAMSKSKKNLIPN